MEEVTDDIDKNFIEEKPTLATTFVLNPQVDITASVTKFNPNPERVYKDKHFTGTPEEYNRLIENSTTIYIGNLSFYTTEFQIQELFSRAGTIKRIIMGLDRNTKKKTGFCFVEYDERDSARRAVRHISFSYLDNRMLNVNIDHGFSEGRQYGRGINGGQICDDREQARSLRQQSRDDSMDNSFNRPRRGGMAGRQRGNIGDSTRFLSSSMTCLTMIGLICIILCTISDVDSSILLHPSIAPKISSPSTIRHFQKGEGRRDFEQAFARLLVNVMKSAKPSLMKAFMKATLEDKKLKEIAIGIFFNSTETATNDKDDLRKRRELIVK